MLECFLRDFIQMVELKLRVASHTPEALGSSDYSSLRISNFAPGSVLDRRVELGIIH